MLKKIQMILIMIFCVIGCKHYEIRNVIPLGVELKRPYRIALIGFYPFKASSTSTRSGRVIRTTSIAELDYDKSNKGLLKIGKPVEDFLEPGFKTNVDQTKIKEFVNTYLDQTKRSGVLELTKLIVSKETKPNETTFQVRNHNADLIVVGFHGPAFRERDKEKTSLWRVVYTGFLFTFTAGFYPGYFGNEVSLSTFHIYDKDLNLVKKYEIKDSIPIYVGILEKENVVRFGNELTPELITYRPQITEFENFLLEFLNERKF